MQTSRDGDIHSFAHMTRRPAGWLLVTGVAADLYAPLLSLDTRI